MKSLIAGLQSQSPQSIADEILKIAKLFSKDEIADDMTVMVTKVWRNSN
jgi:serine phosphatase RsbU (regulator of sigma subunit)